MYTIWDSNRVVRELKYSSDPSILVSSSESFVLFVLLCYVLFVPSFVLLSYIFLLLLPSAPYPPGKPGSRQRFDPAGQETGNWARETVFAGVQEPL